MASAPAKPPERPEIQFVSKLLPDSCLTFYRRLCVVPAAAVIHFGGLVCLYLAIQNLSRSERQQTRENLCWSGVLSGLSGLLFACSTTAKETHIRRNRVKLRFYLGMRDQVLSLRMAMTFFRWVVLTFKVAHWHLEI